MQALCRSVHGYVSPLFARRRHYSTGPATCYTLPRISSFIMLGVNDENWNAPSSLFALAFHKEVVYRIADGCVNTGDDPSTLGKNRPSINWLAWREMIRPQAARRTARPPWRPQYVVKWDRNLKPKLAIMRQCTSITDRRTDRRTLTS